MPALILFLAAVCLTCAGAVFGHLVPISGPVASLCLAVAALAGTLLIGSVEAYESRAGRDDR